MSETEPEVTTPETEVEAQESELSVSTSTEVDQPTPIKKANRKLLIGFIGFIVVLAIIGVAAYLLIFNKPTQQQAQTPQLPSEYTITGLAEKGPFLANSKVSYQELNDDLSPASDLKDVALTDDKGSFTFKIKPQHKNILIVANGYYYDEVRNMTSFSTILLKAIAALGLDANLQVNLNVVTTTEYDRVVDLVTADKLAVSDAIVQSESEILKAFNINDKPSTTFNKVALFSSSNDSAMLLAISVILENQDGAGAISSFISQISDDLKPDGKIDSKTNSSSLISIESSIQAGEIKANLNSRFKDSNPKPVIPNFELYLKTLVDLVVTQTKPVNNTKDYDFRDPYFDVCINQIPDKSTVKNEDFVLKKSSGEVVSTSFEMKGEMCMTVKAASDLSPSTSYTLTVSGIKSQSGNNLAETKVDFTTIASNLSRGLSEHYLFNGNGNDSGGWNIPSTIDNSDFTSDRFGKNDSSLKFSDTGNHVTFNRPPDIINNSSWTISEWFKFDKLEDGQIYGLFRINFDYPVLEILGHNHQLIAYDQSFGSTGAFNPVDTGKWYQVLWRCDGDKISLYLNGTIQQDKSTNCAGAMSNISTYTISSMSGYIDDLRIYNRALNNVEVRELYTLEKDTRITN